MRRRQDRRITAELDRTTINSMKPQNNFVLVKRITDNTHVDIMGKSIKLDPTFNPEFYADVMFEVVAPPKELVYSAKRDEMGNYIVQNNMEWKTQMELREGDICWVSYNQSLNSIKIRCEGDEYRLIHYSHIFLVIRPWDYSKEDYGIHLDQTMVYGQGKVLEANIGYFKKTGKLRVKPGYNPRVVSLNYRNVGRDVRVGSTTPLEKLPDNVMMRREKMDDFDEISYWRVTMLNGYILFSEIPEENDTGLLLPPQNKDRFGVVEYMGRPNEEYREKHLADDNSVRIGDVVHLSYKFSKKLENNPMLTKFGSDKPLHITQRSKILGITKL